jgi:anti-sigma regulatory factor (Ser/Thr protein kinase)
MTAGEQQRGSGQALRVELSRDVRAPARARSVVAEQLASAGIDGTFSQTIVLLVSEVVSNAVRHSAAPADSAIDLRARVTETTVRVEVTDAGEGFTPRARDPERLGEGYGLYLIEKTASSWGVEGGNSTTVWFELARV